MILFNLSTLLFCAEQTLCHNLYDNKKQASNNGESTVGTKNTAVRQASNFQGYRTGDDDEDPSWKNGADKESSKAARIFAPMKQDGNERHSHGKSRKDIHYH